MTDAPLNPYKIHLCYNTVVTKACLVTIKDFLEILKCYPYPIYCNIDSGAKVIKSYYY